MKNQKGFSLIELLIVVVIIGIIAAIAIPNLLAARRSANEGSAVSSLRTLHGAEATYQATSGNGNYSRDTAALGLPDLNAVGLIDQTLSTGSKSGYGFTYHSFDLSTTVPNPASFAVVARPTGNAGLTATGTRNFGISTDGVIGVEVLPATGGMGTMATGGSAALGATFGVFNALGN